MEQFFVNLNTILNTLLTWATAFFNWMISTPIAALTIGYLILSLSVKFFNRIKKIFK